MEPDTVTYSRNVFIPLTNACRNRCGYCSFRSETPGIMSPDEVRVLLEKGAKAGCKEALFTFGERPEIYPEVKDRLNGWGYHSVIEYLRDLCIEAIGRGMLPHSNPGSISKEELAMLGEVNASMGLMLESSSERLCQKGMPHEHSKGKDPAIRLKVIKEAGKLGIPFTTGLLIGIGETDEEVQRSLKAIRSLQDRFGHIQEIIIQNFRPKPGTPMAGFPEPPIERVLGALHHAKELFPDIGLQVPPNLNKGREVLFLKHGANDFGGVSPVTPDYVNPHDSWPTVDYLKAVAKEQGFRLRERLCVYPGHISFAPERLKTLIAAYVDEEGIVHDSS